MKPVRALPEWSAESYQRYRKYIYILADKTPKMTVKRRL